MGEVSIYGKILDIDYTKALMNYTNLSLDEVILLDKIQKNIPLSEKDLRKLKQNGLIEGKFPHYYIASSVAEMTNKKEEYIRNRSFDDTYFRDMILEYIKKFSCASKKDIENLLYTKLSETLNEKQKIRKIDNLLQALRKKKYIYNIREKNDYLWKIKK